MAERHRQPTVAIIGGGLSGLAAACALSDSGFRVTLFERRPYLGGRASSYEHPGTGEVVDNCQHVLFGCCTNLIAFYRTIGILDKIRWFDRMTFIEPGGRQSVLEPTLLPAPFHVSPSFLGLRFLSAWDKVVLTRALTSLIIQPPNDDGRSFQDWLVQHGQTSRAIERFWKPILISALSEDLERIAIPYAAQVVRESMKSPQARRMGIPSVPLTHLYDAASAYIVAQGGSVRLRNSVQRIVPGDSGVRLRGQDAEEQFDYAILAVSFDWTAKLLAEIPGFAGLREKIAHFQTSPITGVHLWFDRQISDLPHAVLLDRTIQWMFHKSVLLDRMSLREGGVPDREAAEKGSLTQDVISGTANNISESGRDDTGRELKPSYVELVISSSKSLIDKSRQEIIDLALAELREFFPAARDANLTKATVIKEVNATFSPTPGIDRYRPTAQTPSQRLFLAGDWTATGWPATMEGAVRSGYLAAEGLTRQTGRAKSFLVADLPPGGLMWVLE
jgi:squalene-associated FAD-dependent desaturase